MVTTAQHKIPDGVCEVGSAPASLLADQPASLIGEPGAWFSLDRDDGAVVVRPNAPLPRRCTIRPAGLFENDREFVEVNIVMGRLGFPNGSSGPQRYLPFTRDPRRKLRELFFPVETMPEDDWPSSARRWNNCQAIAKRLLAAAEISWPGLPRDDLRELVEFVLWPEPLDGCVLHALTQWTHQRGDCVIEIGSYRGASLSLMAMALRAVESDSLLISVDPHEAQPHNRTHVQLALRQIGQEDRLVQIPRRSDDAGKLLANGRASLIFVDGDHGREQVVADFDNYVDLLAPGGCMVFHDYGCGDHNGLPEAHPGVRSAIDEHVIASGKLRPVLLAHTLFALVKPA